MNTLDLDFVPNSLIYWHLTLTLLHVSWIGLVIGLIAATGNRILQNRNANSRYWWNSVSLLAFGVSLPLTFAVVRCMSADDQNNVTTTVITSVPAQQHGALLPTAPTDVMLFTPDQPAADLQSDRSDQSVGSDGSGPGPSSVWADCQHIAKAASPFVAALYVIGVMLMLIKLVIGVRISRSLRAAGQPISDTGLLSRMAIQAKKLSLRIMPVIAYCEHVTVPIVIGLLRPIILVPTAMINGLTPEQLESVLTHELAHLRRHDHLLIVVQRVLEAVLFFHPVTWYLSRRVHDERETCCDDLVLAIGGDRLHYAQSLLRVAELRLATRSRNRKSRTALAADGQRPSKLRQRIARLLGDSSNDSVQVSSIWLVAVLVAFIVTSGWVVNTMATSAAAAEIADDVAPDFESIKSLVGQAPVQQCLVQANAFAVDSSEAETTNVKPLIANIDKDHSLELVAVVSLDDSTKAWSPDGTQIEPQPTWPVLSWGRPQEHATHGFIFRCTGWKDETAIAWHVPGLNVTPSRSDTVPESIGLTGTFTDLKTGSVRAGLTTPNWGPWVSIGFDDIVAPYETTPEFSELYARIKPHTFAISKGYGYALVLQGINGVDERAVHEEVAVWKDGTLHIRRGLGLTKDIDVISSFEGVDLMDHLEYRLRPYVHWVTFENVSLAPGVKSEAKVSVQTLELPKKAAQKLQGHVRDAEGKPVAGAKVAVRTASVGIPKTMGAKTDSDGRFELPFSGDAWPKHIPLVLWAWAPGYAVNVETQFGSKDDLATPVNITLNVPDKVRFRVTDPQGNAVAGFDVTPSTIAMRMPNAFMMTELIDTLPEFLRRTSDADGIVELDSFQGASLHSLSIQSVDYGRQCFDVQHNSTSLIDTNGVIRLRLQPTTQVRGRLVGAPAEFLKVIQVDVRTDVKDWPYGRVEGFATAVTDDQGRFEVAAIVSGELLISQHADSEAIWRIVPNRHKHTLVSGTSPEIEFVLKETVEVPFKIIRKDKGSPVAGVGVVITDESGFHEVATGTH